LPGGTEVGQRLSIHHGFGLVVSRHAKLGDDVTLRHGTTLGSRRSSTDCPTVGNGVDIGANSTILGAIHLGSHSIIGAGSVVLNDVPSGSTAAGNPARVINGLRRGLEAQ
jgi:serine acetyltransferase